MDRRWRAGQQLALRSPDGHIDLSGTLSPWMDGRAAAKPGSEWRAGDTDLAGTLTSRSDGKQARIELHLAKPTPATATVTIEQDAKATWNLVLDVPGSTRNQSSPTARWGNWPTCRAAARANGELGATVQIDQHTLAIEPLHYALNDGIVSIETLHLTSPASTGALDISGTLDTGASPLAADPRRTGRASSCRLTWPVSHSPRMAAWRSMAAPGNLPRRVRWPLARPMHWPISTSTSAARRMQSP
ncbi:MAG: hypothetical protein IPH43_14400 [Xanthomonadales bacterium]|nr:hypothetical protein [Xanthomonadales bacterium]